MKNQAQIKDRISEQDYSDRLTSLIKTDINTRLGPLKSLKNRNQKAEGVEKAGKREIKAAS
jgi:hypothetical protein